MTRLSPAVTIVLVSYNAQEDLRACLSSLSDAARRTPHEIVVVDNASTDGSADAVEQGWPDVRVVRNADNVGFARANNQAVAITSAPLILLLNSDTIAPPGSIDRLVGMLGARPEVAAIGPRLVDVTGTPELSFGRMVGPWAELWQKVIGRLHARGFGPARRYVERMTHREHAPDWVSGACLLVRRSAALSAGLLDERYFMYLEDVDFCAALRAGGGEILFTPAVEVVHKRGRSVASARRATSARYRESQVAFYEKHCPAWAPLLRGYLRLTGKWPPRQVQ